MKELGQLFYLMNLSCLMRIFGSSRKRIVSKSIRCCVCVLTFLCNACPPGSQLIPGDWPSSSNPRQMFLHKSQRKRSWALMTRSRRIPMTTARVRACPQQNLVLLSSGYTTFLFSHTGCTYVYPSLSLSLSFVSRWLPPR